MYYIGRRNVVIKNKIGASGEKWCAMQQSQNQHQYNLVPPSNLILWYPQSSYHYHHHHNLLAKVLFTISSRKSLFTVSCKIGFAWVMWSWSYYLFMPFAAGTLIVHVQDVQAKMSLALISLHYFVMFAKMATAAIVAALCSVIPPLTLNPD